LKRAREVRKMDHLSSSQMNLYLQCSLKYKFQYIDEIPRPFKPSGLAFGSAVHSALSWLHKEAMNGRGVSLEKLYKIFDSDWYSLKLDNEIRFKQDEEEMKLVLMGKEMLGLYYHNNNNKVIGAEIPFVVPLKHPSNGESLEVPLEGFIDLIEQDDTITEFKTSGARLDKRSIDENLQLTAYSYAYEMLYQKPPKLLKVINFVKTRTPKMILLKTKRDKGDYETFFYLAKEVLRGIQAHIFFPRSSFMCKDCEYERCCKAWEGNGA
jgi:putative RecB family exonuclease